MWGKRRVRLSDRGGEGKGGGEGGIVQYPTRRESLFDVAAGWAHVTELERERERVGWGEERKEGRRGRGMRLFRARFCVASLGLGSDRGQ